MQIAQLQAIVEIERAGSFRGAAAKLGRSQPSLTRLIHQIEDEIGLPIFNRSPTGARLTAEGLRVHARALSVLAELERLEDEVSQLRDHRGGTVRLAVSPAGGAALLPNTLRRFRKTWPHVNVEVADTIFPESINLLRSGQVEIVVGPVPQDFSDPSIDTEWLSDLQIVLVTNQSNPLRHATRLADLMEAQWFVHGPESGPSTLFSARLDFLSKVSVTHCYSLTTLLATIVENQGFAFLSDGLFAQLQARYGLARVPIGDELPKLSLSISIRNHVPLTPAAEAFHVQLKQQSRALANF